MCVYIHIYCNINIYTNIIVTVTVNCCNFFNYLISYYSSFISITYVIFTNYLYLILSIIYFHYIFT